MNVNIYRQSRSYGGALLFLIGLLIFPAALLADEVSITNDVSVSANTGGNSASGGDGTNGTDGAQGGSVSEGNSSSHVKVYTEVNGEVVTDIDLSADKAGETAEGGEEIVIDETVNGEGVSVQTHVRAKAEDSETDMDTTTEEIQNNQEEGAASDSSAAAIEADTPSGFSIRSLIRNVFTYVFGLFR